ncbi:MAG: type II toxin-antitoxin system HicA family toxin [Eubacterium sp.]
MKRKDLIKKLEKAGFELSSHGGNHDIYRRGNDKEEVPRHREINEILAKSIIKKWRLE